MKIRDEIIRVLKIHLTSTPKTANTIATEMGENRQTVQKCLDFLVVHREIKSSIEGKRTLYYSYYEDAPLKITSVVQYRVLKVLYTQIKEDQNHQRLGSSELQTLTVKNLMAAANSQMYRDVYRAVKLFADVGLIDCVNSNPLIVKSCVDKNSRDQARYLIRQYERDNDTYFRPPLSRSIINSKTRVISDKQKEERKTWKAEHPELVAQRKEQTKETTFKRKLKKRRECASIIERYNVFKTKRQFRDKRKEENRTRSERAYPNFRRMLKKYEEKPKRRSSYRARRD